MGDPFSTTASIIAVLQVSASAVEYLGDVKDASEDCKRILPEINLTRGVLVLLKELCEEAEQDGEAWSGTIRSLNVKEGPLYQLASGLQELTKKVQATAAARGVRKAARALSWPFKKSDSDKIVAALERQKMLLLVALDNDETKLLMATRKDV